MPKKDLYALVRDKNFNLQIMHGTFDHDPQEGEVVERDPMTSGSQWWVIVKVYDARQQDELESLTILMGFEAVKNLFNVDMDPYYRALHGK